MLCPIPPYRDHLDTLIRRSGTLQLDPAFPERLADVVLCVIGCLLDLRDLFPSIPASLRPRTVLYLLSDGPGALIAGLHGFRGYLPRDATQARILRCLQRVARGEIDAPRPHRDLLLQTLESPPISPRDREILQRLAMGQTHKRIASEVRLATRTVDAHIARLKELFGVESTYGLVALAVAVGVVWSFENEPSIVWLPGNRGGGVEGDGGDLRGEEPSSASGTARIRTCGCRKSPSRTRISARVSGATAV